MMPQLLLLMPMSSPLLLLLPLMLRPLLLPLMLRPLLLLLLLPPPLKPALLRTSVPGRASLLAPCFVPPSLPHSLLYTHACRLSSLILGVSWYCPRAC